jgi:Zn-dependent protease
MRNWSVPAGRIFGVQLRIHLTFILLLLFVVFTEAASHTTTNPFRGMALVGVIFLCVVLHELGHALVSRRAGIPAKAIILLPRTRWNSERKPGSEISALRWPGQR